MKKLLGLLLIALFLSWGAVRTDAAPIEGTCGDNLTWTLENGTLTISGTGEMKTYHFYEKIPWSDYADNIHTVVVGDGVESITENAFGDCNYLTKVTIGSSVKLIDWNAFSSCTKLTEVRIPDSVIEIKECAFSNCSSLKYVYTGNGVTTIYGQAFKGCISLERVYLGQSVTLISFYAFEDCPALTDVYYNGSEADMLAIIIYDEGNTALQNAAWHYGGSGRCGENAIWTLYGDGTLAIEGFGLTYNCSSKDAVPWCSYANRIRKVVLDEGMTSIGRYLFSDCTNLKEIVLPDTLTSIENYAFQNCSSLTAIRLPEGITTIGSSAFYNCASLETISIPSTVTELSSYVFRGCTNLESVAFGSSIRSIGDQAFAGCKKLAYVYYNGTLAQKNSITVSPVGNTPLNNAIWLYTDQGAVFTLPAELTEIQSNAFLGTNAEIIVIPASCSFVSADAFSNCPRLKYIINRADIRIVPPAGVSVIAG